MNKEIIGKTLAIITKQQSKYQGTLVDFDTVKKTMTLKDVKQLGTEGRRNGVNEIPAKDGIVSQIKFKVELIQEFDIVQEQQEEDPAILESTKDEHMERR